jgi:cytochrome P450
LPETLDITALPTLQQAGFTGGRDNFHSFCQRNFAAATPRFLRTEDNALVVFRHADLMAFGTSALVGNVPPGVAFPGRLDAPEGTIPAAGKRVAEVLASQIFFTNPPIHGATRRILLNWIGPKKVGDMEGLVREVVEEILDGLETGAEVDFVPVVAEALTVGFWARLLHLTAAETAEITEAVRGMTRLFVFERNLDDLAALDLAFDAYARILDAAAERGLAQGDPALLEIERQIQELEFAEDIHVTGLVPRSVGQVLSGNLIDGFHTAALATANTCFSLSRHPEVLDEVRAEPALLAKAIAEALRMEPPVLFLKRYLLGDFDHDGTVVPAGTLVVMMWGAGNHDPAAFPAPERFDLNRRQQGLTTFGNGAHICPGRYVGVMLTRLLLEGFAARGLRFVPGAAASEWIPGHIMGQLQRLPLRVDQSA